MTRTISIPLALIVCSLAAGSPAAAQSKQKSELAMATFTSQRCVMCHSIGLKGNPKGSLDDVGAKLKADEIRQWLTDPEGMRAKSHATRTPAMKPTNLTPQQVDALVAYLQTLKSPALNADNASK